MTELAQISPERHAKKAWKQATDYAFAAEDTFIPLVGAELSKVMPAMPIGFITQEVGYQLAAITSLQPRTNLYVTSNGEWLGPYVPAALRAYPFRLVRQENAEDFTLCINEASGLVFDSDEDGNAFFDDQEEPSLGIKDIINFLTEVEVSRAGTQAAVNALADAGLIIPWALELKLHEEVMPVEGLFHVDEAALNKLNEPDFLALRKAGGLAVAYAQLLSMNQLAELERLGEIQGQILAQQATNSKVANLTGFSLDDDEGSLSFD